MFNKKRTPEQEAYLDEVLERAESLKHLTSLSEWKYVQAYMENSIRLFTNKAVLEGFSNMEEFNLARGEVLGFNKMIASISSDLETLENERSKPATK